MPARAPARPDEARILARACLIAATVVAATAVVPFSPTAPRTLGAAIAAIGLVVGLALRTWGDRARVWHIHTTLALATLLITVCVAESTTPQGTLVTAVSYVWVVMFTAAFHRRPTMLRHIAGVASGLGLGLWQACAPAGPYTWAYLTVTYLAVALVLNGRVTALREALATDPLTGALSRRAFRQAAQVEMSRARRTGGSLTLVVLDLDDFKDINDEHGHAAGDAVLAGLVRGWQLTLRPGDSLGRFGGDEFTLLLPDTTADGARALLSRLRSDLCGWSAGVATWVPGQSFEDWFAAADADMYAEKGR